MVTGGDFMTFHGRNQYKLDSKGRIPFPTIWFEPMDLRFGESVVVARGLSSNERYLEIFSPKSWEEKMKKIKSSFPEGQLKNNFIRWYVSSAESVELDTQNRMRLPANLIKYCNLKKDVVLLGALDTIQIWALESLNIDEDFSGDDFDKVFEFMNASLNKDSSED